MGLASAATSSSAAIVPSHNKSALNGMKSGSQLLVSVASGGISARKCMLDASATDVADAIEKLHELIRRAYKRPSGDAPALCITLCCLPI